MAENREPPPDLFDAEENLSEEETLEEPKPAEDETVDDIQETVEVSLDNEENGKDEPVEASKDENAETTVNDPIIPDDPAPKEAEKVAETSPESPETPEEKKDEDKSEVKPKAKPRVTFETEKNGDEDEQQNGEPEDHEDEEEFEETDEFDIEIKVSDPEKVGDGMGAYMCYKVTTMTSLPSFKKPETSVSRRFSDFLGLHERLNAKFLLQGKVVPPAPEKSVLGMTKVKLGKEESTSADFVERRRASLERYLNRTASHPALREDSEFREFLELENLPRASGTAALSGGGFKRLVKNVGDTMFNLTTKIEESDQWFEDKHNKIDALETQLKKLHQALESLVNNRKELSTSTTIFSNAIAVLSSAEEHSALSRALSNLAEVEEKVDKVIQSQMETDFYVLAELIKDYLGLVHSVKMCFNQRLRVYTNLQNAQQNLTKKREVLVKAELASKTDRVKQCKDEVSQCERKVEKCQEDFKEISKTIRKEFTRFEHNRTKDFRAAIIQYLEALMENQQQVLKHWEGYLPEAKEIA
ncbi:sorting nexin-2-like [Dendronephthya gigantea]|uniref:sorting nexin-2-like n=1 Tax=Dendronephthya gigantea TaxID=151771 RepID=UPI00106C245A|nr:sorting nexin-2-like [Dendronephthya gigantea]